MSDAVAQAVDSAHDEHHDHPSDWEYVKIAVVLAVITAVEVLTYFESVFTIFQTRWVLLSSLFVMMVVKFWLVARMFMHLKQDRPVLSQTFVFGIILAVAVYIAMLAAFNFF